MKTKQVIVIRKDTNPPMRKGKMVAQACHASMQFLYHRVFDEHHGDPYFSEAEEHWFKNDYTKVCCSVDSEEELLKIYEEAKSSGLEVHLITDLGKTEFKEPTRTCLAIGPDESEKIDPITKHLKLL